MDDDQKFRLFKRKLYELFLDAWGDKIHADFMMLETGVCVVCRRRFGITHLSATMHGYVCDCCRDLISNIGAN